MACLPLKEYQMLYSKCSSVGHRRNNFCFCMQSWASRGAQVVKNPPANAGDIRDLGSIPGSGISPGGVHGNPLQYSCLKNPMDRGAWPATAHGVAKSWTRLKQLNMHACLSEMVQIKFLGKHLTSKAYLKRKTTVCISQ